MIEINLLRWRVKKRDFDLKRWRILIISAMIFLMSLIIYLSRKPLTVPQQIQQIEHKQPLASIAENIPIEQLQLAGYLVFNDIFKAFLRLPTGEIREIKTGSVIGKENARVLILDKQKMVMEVDGSRVIKKYSLLEG